MLTPGYIAQTSEKVRALWQQLEDDILQDVSRRIAKTGEYTATAQWQLWRAKEIKALNKNTTGLIAQYTNKSKAEIKRIFKERSKTSYLADRKIFTEAGLKNRKNISAYESIINAMLKNTNGTLTNLTRTTATTVQKEFVNALDRAHMQVISGAFTNDQAVRIAVNNLADNMKYVTYQSGHTDTLEVAVTRAVRTGVNQTASKVSLKLAEDFGCDLVETTAHSGARPDHAEWQGKIFSLSGKHKKYKDFYKETGYGTGAGLCGWNCRHSFYPYFEDLSEPVYTDAQLKRLNARNIEYKGKMYTEYEISQMQRKMERDVRKAKREYLAEQSAGLDTTVSATFYKKTNNKLKQFIADNNTYIDSSRTMVSGFGHSQRSKAVYQGEKILEDIARDQPNVEIDANVILKQKTINEINKALELCDNARYNIDSNTIIFKIANFEKELYLPLPKIVNYSLKEENKARVFKAILGYEQSNYLDLITNLITSLNAENFKEKYKNGYGLLFENYATLKGPNGNTADVLSSWIDKNEETNIRRLTSFYIKA